MPLDGMLDEEMEETPVRLWPGVVMDLTATAVDVPVVLQGSSDLWAAAGLLVGFCFVAVAVGGPRRRRGREHAAPSKCERSHLLAPRARNVYDSLGAAAAAAARRRGVGCSGLAGSSASPFLLVGVLRRLVAGQTALPGSCG